MASGVTPIEILPTRNVEEPKFFTNRNPSAVFCEKNLIFPLIVLNLSYCILTGR